MKILAFVDTHGDRKAHNTIKKKAKEADLLLMAGDISNFEDKLTENMKDIDSVGKPILVIHGNHEDQDSMRRQCKMNKNTVFLHKGMFRIENYIFFGYGGGGFAEDDREFEKVAKDFKKAIKDAKEEVKKKHHGKKLKIVLILHAPPHGTDMDRIDGRYVGNKSYRKFIDETKPTLVVCGHIHENAGRDQKVGKTILVNPGPEGVIIEL